MAYRYKKSLIGRLFGKVLCLIGLHQWWRLGFTSYVCARCGKRFGRRWEDSDVN